MRGDCPDSKSVKNRAVINEYIHAYYEYLEPIDRDGMFTLNLDSS